MLDCTAAVIEEARQRNLPLVIDGDGLWLVQKRLSVIKGYPRAILTPNAMEFSRLWKAQFPNEPEDAPMSEVVAVESKSSQLEEKVIEQLYTTRLARAYVPTSFVL
jgi:NAD(P)H-hydrate repair Nnr-like enzyme with NAD(P)H-hydrate dehydratase domain